MKQGRVPQTLWSYKEVGHNQEAKKELLRRVQFGSSDSVFETPKPTRLIRRMLHLGTQADQHDLVLDFFAGSGSSGDAVMQLNAEDSGNRRFILVQLPERTGATDYSTIAEITKARLRAASEAIEEETSDKLPGLATTDQRVDLGFQVLKLASSNIKPWDTDFDALDESLLNSVDNIKSERGEDDVLCELLLKFGLDLAIPIESRAIAGKKVSIIGAGALVVCLATDVTLLTVEGIAALKDELKPEVMRVVFRDSGFADDVVKTNTVQILKQAGIDDVKSL